MTGAFAVERLRPAYTQVAAQLRQLVINGEVVPGDRLPVETELAAMFGVSRSTVREALRSLASEHLVVTKRGVNGGTFVAEPSAAELSAYMETSLGLLAGTSDISVQDLLEARTFLEVPAARCAAERRTVEQLERLAASLDEVRPSGISGATFEGHKNFHLGVMEASGNRLLTVVAGPIFTVLRTRFLRDRAPKDFWKCVASDHGDIYAAIEHGDAKVAGDLMHEHLLRLRATYEAIDVESPGAAHRTER